MTLFEIIVHEKHEMKPKPVPDARVFCGLFFGI